MALPGGSSDLRKLAWIIQLFCFFGSVHCFKVIEKPVNQSSKVGETVVLRCRVEAEDGELVSATWFKAGTGQLGADDDRILGGWPQYSIIGDEGKGEYHLQIKPVSLSDDAEFECQVRPSFRAVAAVSVLVAPTNITLEPLRDGGITEVFDGSTVEVTCAVLGGKPEAEILWYRNDKQIKDGITVSTHVHADKTVDTRARLNFLASAEDHKAQYTCRALHLALPEGSSIQTNYTLSVIYQPGTPVITGYANNQIVTAGEKLKLQCEVTNGNPFPQLLWLRNTKSIDSSFHNQPDITVNDYEFEVNHEDDQAEYTCVTKNQATVTPLSSSVTLKVYYAPSKVDITGKLEGKAGEKLPLQCVTAPSRPVSTIQWIINGKPFTSFTTALRDVPNSSGKITVSNATVEIPEDQTSDFSVTCSAVNEELQRQTGKDSRKSTSATISVQYPPSSVTLYGAPDAPLRAEQPHLLTCVVEGGKPTPEIHWFKGRRRVNEGITVSHTSGSVQSELRFKVNAKDNRAQYRCEAHSSALNKPLQDTANLTVYFPPKDVNITVTSSTKTRHLKAGDYAQLICESGSSNPTPVLTWYDEGVNVSSEQVHSGTGENFGHTVKNKLYVPLDPSKDGATYTCRAENRQIEMHVSKSVTISVHYAPQFLIANPQILTVRENESVSVNVTAKAKPSNIVYRWRKLGSNRQVAASARYDGGLWAKGPMLYAEKVQRGDAGSYVVTAKNSEGETNFSVNITVEYPANVTKKTDPVVADIGSSVSLECEADAYPTVPRMVHWERDNFDMSIGSQIFEDTKTIYSIKSVQKSHSGIFFCVASNGIGTPVRSNVTLLVRQAPELDHSVKYRKAAGQIGGRAVLRCRAIGAPAVDIDWFRDGIKLASNGQRVTVSSRKSGVMTYEGTIEFEQVEREDYGVYSCAAKNELGKHEMQVELVKVGPPSYPENLKQINVSGTSVELGWKPGFDGGMPQSFQIRYRILGESKYEMVLVEPADITRYTVRNLKPYTRYSFTIGARNRVGFSGYSESADDQIVIETGGSDGQEMTQGRLNDPSPLLMIILICIAGVVLLILNLCILCCCIKRVRKKKMAEKTSKARLVDVPRPVQMYGPDSTTGLRPDSQYSDHPTKGRSEFSEDDQSVRTIIEVDATGQPVYRADRISPGTYQTYLVDDPCAALMPYDYADTPSGANYAERLRNNSLQRRIAAGQYSPDTYAESGAPPLYPGEGFEDPMVPPLMGPLRTMSEELNQYAPYSQYSPARSNGLLRRYSPPGQTVSPPPATLSSAAGVIPLPTAIVQTHSGNTPFAEVRPMVTHSLNNNNNGHNGGNNGSLRRYHDSHNNASSPPLLSTFGGTNSKPIQQEYLDMEELTGDLV